MSQSATYEEATHAIQLAKSARLALEASVDSIDNTFEELDSQIIGKALLYHQALENKLDYEIDGVKLLRSEYFKSILLSENQGRLLVQEFEHYVRGRKRTSNGQSIISAQRTLDILIPKKPKQETQSDAPERHGLISRVDIPPVRNIRLRPKYESITVGIGLLNAAEDSRAQKEKSEFKYWAYVGYPSIHVRVGGIESDPVRVFESIGEKKLSRTFGIAAHPLTNNLYIGNQGTSEVYLCTPEGELLHSLNKPRDGPTLPTFSVLLGVAVSPLGRVAVASNATHDVHLFTSEMEHIATLTKFVKLDSDGGNEETPSGGPISVAFDTNENLYVSDHNLNSVAKFGPDGEFIKSVDHQSVEGLRGVYGLGVDDDGRVLCIAYAGTSIVVLNSELEYLQTFTLPAPTRSFNSINRGPDGGFLVTDYAGNAVHFLTRDGTMTGSVSVPGSPTAACFAGNLLYVARQDACAISVLRSVG